MVIALGSELVPTTSATGAMQLLWLIPAIPLAVAAVNLFVGRRLGRWAGWLAVLAVLASFSIAVAAVLQLVGLAIILNVYRRRQSASVDDASVLRG